MLFVFISSESEVTSSQMEENETSMPGVSHWVPQQGNMATPQACRLKSRKQKRGKVYLVVIYIE